MIINVFVGKKSGNNSNKLRFFCTTITLQSLEQMNNAKIPKSDVLTFLLCAC